MSMAPNNPFEQNQDGPAGAPPKKKKSPWLMIFGIIAGLGIVGVMVCCGIAYFSMGQLGELAAEPMKMELQGNPVIAEHIGDIESMSMNLSAVMKEAQKQQEAGGGGETKMVFDINGSKGSGQIHANEEQLTSLSGTVTLVMGDGTQHDVELSGAGFSDDADMNFDMDDIDVGDIDVGELQESTP